MKAIGKIIGIILWVGSGLLMFGYWSAALSGWLGFIGVILAFILAPGIVVFPIVFWLVEGIFPGFYFMLWGTGLVGLMIAGVCTAE